MYSRWHSALKSGRARMDLHHQVYFVASVLHYTVDFGCQLKLGQSLPSSAFAISPRARLKCERTCSLNSDYSRLDLIT